MALDLSQLDAESPNFHLMIQPPQAFQVPVRPVTHQIARSVKPWAASTRDRIGDELLRRQFRAIQVSARDPAPPMYNSPGTPTGTGCRFLSKTYT